MLRFGCAQVVIDRLDPLVNPGSIPSTHQHQIVGGNGFNASMATTDVSKMADCTTCAFSKDFRYFQTPLSDSVNIESDRPIATVRDKSTGNGAYKRIILTL